LKSPGEEHTFAYNLCFPCSNNEAKYKALVVGLKATKRLGIKKLKVFWDSELVIKQIGGPYGVKNPSLATYRATVQDLMKHFTSIECKVINWNENKLANSLATLATKSMLKKEKMTLQKVARTLVEDNDPGKGYWIEPAIKHEGHPQD